MFGDRLYVELERLAGYDRGIEAATIDLAYRHRLPLVATNEAFFPSRADYEAHDALIAIAEGSVVAEDNRRRLTPDNFLKSQKEMAELFADLPEAIDNTVEIARRCSYYPEEPQSDPAALHRWRYRRRCRGGGGRGSGTDAPGA